MAQETWQLGRPFVPSALVSEGTSRDWQQQLAPGTAEIPDPGNTGTLKLAVEMQQGHSADTGLLLCKEKLALHRASWGALAAAGFSCQSCELITSKVI